MITRAKHVLPLCVALLAGALMGTWLHPWSQASEPKRTELEVTLSLAARRAMPAVVNISTTKVVKETPFSPLLQDPFFRKFFGGPFFFHIPRERVERSLGSGVIVRSDGYVLTNHHVVKDADKVVVFLQNRRRFTAKVVGSDPHTDLALLHIEAKELPVLPWGDSEAMKVGDIVLAIGNPFGVGETVTMGIISAKGRSNVGLVEYEDFIQTDAAINPGNSGGALINTRGELIGINTAIVTRSGGYQGIGFAIPSNMARAVMEQLLKTGKVVRGWLGVYIQEVTPEMAEAFGLKKARGALVSEVMRGSPAAKAGIKRGDVIVGYDGRPVKDTTELRLLVAQTPPGRTVELELVRNGHRLKVHARIGEQPAKLAMQAEGIGTLGGLKVGELTPDRARQLGLPSGTTGVVVEEVEPGSPAWMAGLRPGDVIQEVNRQPVRSVEEFQRAMAEAGRRVLLLVNRRGRTIFLMFELER